MKKIVVLISLVVLIGGLSLSTMAQILDSPPRDGVYDKMHVLEKSPIAYAYVREADIMWEKGFGV